MSVGRFFFPFKAFGRISLVVRSNVQVTFINAVSYTIRLVPRLISFLKAALSKAKSVRAGQLPKQVQGPQKASGRCRIMRLHRNEHTWQG